jgi:hypothetical protein
VDVPLFQPSQFITEFPFFDQKGSFSHTDIVARDEVIGHINRIIYNRLDKDKYWPVIISTSRGMGKTFLLMKFGMQQIKDNLKTDIIGHAMSSGRILSFDFQKQPNAIQNDDDVFSFFTRLMIFFLCRIFDGTQVDGIHFEKTAFDLVSSHSGRQPKFNLWLKKMARYRAEWMMQEYIRLTNIAFGTTYDVPPVFLLDEIQKLCCPSNVASTFSTDGTLQMHSWLSLLLTQLACNLKPVCICTGTNSGKIISITEKSTILPQVLSLTPLVNENEYRALWAQLTTYSNQSSSQCPEIEMDSDSDLINALVYASYQIPRLIYIAHSVWFETRKQGAENLEYYIQKFEETAVSYYSEMVGILNEFSTESMAHILLACGVHWIVKNEASNVPGTQISWDTLIQKSLVFPYLDKCYIFPFSLVWRVSLDASEKKEQIERRCAELVFNLKVRDLFVSYDSLCRWDNYSLGVGYETLFASSLAVKYYLHSISTGEKGYFNFPKIYDVDSSEEPAYDIMQKYKVDFSEGISVPNQEAFTNSSNLGRAVVHNRNIHNAHHDMILPSLTNAGPVNIAVQAKASFKLDGDKKINSQLQVHLDRKEQVKQLFWLYLGDYSREGNFASIVFLDGSGCCNGLALDLFILVKNLKSKNQSNQYNNAVMV